MVANRPGVGHVEAADRRVRGMVDGQWLFDTRRAIYCWTNPHYPRYHIPAADVRTDLIVDPLIVDPLIVDPERPDGAEHVTASPHEALVDTYCFEWSAVDHWFEEDEEIFVHPRSPYVRVDALRSSTPVRVEIHGVVVAEASGSVIVFETGLPARHYIARTSIDWSHLTTSENVTECPYKGTTTGYWHAVIGGRTLHDVCWSYDFPTAALLPIAGLVAFYGERPEIEIS